MIFVQYGRVSEQRRFSLKVTIVPFVYSLLTLIMNLISEVLIAVDSLKLD
jgi:hypothetical protein